MDASRKEGLPNDLSLSEIEVLSFIGPDGKSNMKSVAEHLKITPPSATALITELEKKGMIERTQDTDDRRNVYITFTEKARTIYISIHNHKKIILEEMLSRLDAEDRKTLERIIITLIKE